MTKKSIKRLRNKEIWRNRVVLMLEVPHKNGTPRRFFTPKNHDHYLVEFIRFFGAKLYRVTVEEAEILPLRDLIKSITDKNYNNVARYKSPKEIIIDKISTTKRSIALVVHKEKQSIEYNSVEEAIKVIAVTQTKFKTTLLFEKLYRFELSDSTIRKKFCDVRKKMESEGYSFMRSKDGFYHLLKPND